MEINYKKNKNTELFEQMENEELCYLENPQNYIPIYNKFFNLSETNYNSINLNNQYNLFSLNEKMGYSKFNGIIVDNSNNKINKKIFFKYSPLVDPIKYMIGKYELSYNILELPKIKNTEIAEKVLDPNNSAYSDGFFSYLSSILLNNYNFYNGIDYYGSFLGIKNDFKLDIEDDIDYLDDSEFFHKNNNVLFKIEETENYKNIFSNTKKNRKSIDINKGDEFDDIKFDDINDITDIHYNFSECKIKNIEDSESNSKLELEYDNNSIVNLSDISCNKNKKKKKTNSLNNSSSSCSSRYSNTESSNNEDSDEEDTDDETEYSSSEGEEELIATIQKFPVQTIALECCNDTLDSYIINGKSRIKDDEWESIVLQILFTLITYQKVYDFTHNDLHTNNIVYIETEKKYLYYKYDNTHYKVPTYGKIYKIIDFGRAIYRYKGTIICSDSYAPEGDAHTQYNCEPYLNDEKPRLDPNYSFDLCRLGCSLFDYFIDDLDLIKRLKSPIKKMMVQWVYDDKGKNILYKNDSSERYPDFKLYKMIARTVSRHKPTLVLKNPLFENYKIARKNINKSATIINIDKLPIMT